MKTLRKEILQYAGIISKASGEQLANICNQLYNNKASEEEIRNKINSIAHMPSEYEVKNEKSVLKNFANSPKEWKESFFSSIKNVPLEFANNFWTNYLIAVNNLMKSNNGKGSDVLKDKAKEEALKAAQNNIQKNNDKNKKIKEQQPKFKYYASIFTY